MQLGTPEHLALRAQVTTGIELEDSGAVRALSGATWRERRERLGTFGVEE